MKTQYTGTARTLSIIVQSAAAVVGVGMGLGIGLMVAGAILYYTGALH